MNRRKLFLMNIVVVLLALQAAFFPACSLHAQERKSPPAEKYIKAYEYDHALPLNATEKGTQDTAAYTLHHIEFDSTNNERIPANLYLPKKGTAPYPCIVVQHGYNDSKQFGGLFANTLAPRGYAIISIDMQYHGDRKEPGKDVLSTDAEANVRALTQSVVDLRRAVDYLESRGDIDRDRIGYIGASLGSFLGAIFNGIDKRVKTVVLIVAGGDWEEMVRKSNVSSFDPIREQARDAAGMKAFAVRMEQVEPLLYVGGISPRPLLMLSCENDTLVPKTSGEKLYAAAGDPKEIKWYTCMGAVAHVPPIDKATVMIKKWFDNTLKK